MNKNLQSGFTLIQVVVAASIMTVLSLAIGTLILEQHSTVISLEDKLESVQIKTSIERILMDEIACNNTFGGKTVSLPIGNETSIVNIKDKNNTIQYDSNTKKNFIKIGQMKIINNNISAGDTNGTIRLVMPLEYTRGKNKGLSMRPFTVDFLVTLDSASVSITSCSLDVEFPRGSTCGMYTNINSPITSLCKGHNPFHSCPPGFSRAGGDYQSPGNRHLYFCVKL